MTADPQVTVMTNHAKTVLVVEDSPVQALALINLLQMRDLNVLFAPQGSLGLSLAISARPDAIVLDADIPEMNGLEVCQALKADSETADIPVIILTAHTELAILPMSLTLSATDFIPKDAFSDKVLLETLRQLKILDEPESVTLPQLEQLDVHA
jgi:CheY-like chemotaxis protein